MWIFVSWIVASVIVSIVFGMVARGIREEDRGKRAANRAKLRYGSPKLTR